jgi:hypothetical protein
MTRATTGILPSTPLRPLIADGGLTPIIFLLNYRKSRYAQRLYQNPYKFSGSETIIEGKSQLETILRKTSLLRNEMRIERRWNEGGLKFNSKIVENSEDAKRICLGSREDKRTISWADRSRMEDENVGCAAFLENIRGREGAVEGRLELKGYQLELVKSYSMRSYMQFSRSHGDFPVARSATNIYRFFGFLISYIEM